MADEAREFREQLTQKVRKQMWASLRYKEGRLGKMQQPIDLLYGRVRQKKRQQFNVPLPILSGLYETVLADLDDPVSITYKAGKASDYFAVEKANAAWKTVSQSMDSTARWAYKDRMSRKQAVLYGRGILKYFSQGSPYKSVLSVIDFPDFIFQPDGGGNLENHLFCGEIGITKTQSEIKKGVNAGIYDEEAAQTMVDKISEDSEYSRQMTTEDRGRYARFRAVGLDPNAESYTGEITFNLAEMYTVHKGKRYYILLEPWTGEALRVELLSDMQSSDLYPYVTYATHEDDKNFWSTAIVPDILWPSSDAIVTLFNQQLTNNQKQNLNARMYDKDMVKNVGELDEAQYRPDSLIKIDTLGGSRDINKASVAFVTPVLQNTTELITWIEQMMGKQAAVVQDLPKLSKKSSTNGLMYAEIQQLQKRIDYRSHSYTEAWADLGRRILDGWKDNLTEPLSIELLGPDGYMMRDYLKRSDLKKLGTPSVIVSSTKQQAQEDSLKKQHKVQAITMLSQDPSTAQLLNSKKKAHTILSDIGGYSEAEIEEWFDTKNFYAKDILAQADMAIEMILKGKEPDSFGNANLAFISRLQNFEKSHHDTLTQKQSGTIMAYIIQHLALAQKNTDDAAQSVKSQQSAQQSAQQNTQQNTQAQSPTQGQPPRKAPFQPPIASQPNAGAPPLQNPIKQL